jgi:hypothetical protein
MSDTGAMDHAVALAAHLQFVSSSLEIRIRAMNGEDVEQDRVSTNEGFAAEARRHVDALRDVRTPFALTNTEEAVLWVMAALSLDPRMRSSLRVSGAGGGLTLDAVRLLVYGEGPSVLAARELSSAGTLRRLALIDRCDAGRTDVPEGHCEWTISGRVLRWLQGDDELDLELSKFAAVSTAPVDEVITTDDLFGAFDATVRGNGLLVVSGIAGSGRRTALLSAAARHEVRTLEIDCRRLAKTTAAMVQQLRQVVRECRLFQRSPLLRNIDALVDENDATRVDAIGEELVAEIDGPVLVTCGARRPAMRWGRPTIVIEMKPPTSAQRAKLWLAELGQGTAEDGEYLTTQYPLAPALIHHAAKAAKLHANGRDLQPEDITAGVRAALDDKLGDYATRVEVTQTWDDLVLPDEQLEAIQYLIARIRQRRTVYEEWGFAAKIGKGLGTSALFSGPPGTGKTMVAALIAKELGLELYQVDMSKVTSKWVGETERNLAAVFDAAEGGHTVLLFDEADSLFGKRTEVKSSNDRYANLETNYLLQRLESFTGICLLTSNHESNIDPAFQRRLSLHLRFELPDVAERAALWRALLPAAAPVEPNLDTSGLARRFQMSGGYIRNAALRAAFLAADEGVAISSAHLERAATLEYEGMGKIAA